MRYEEKLGRHMVYVLVLAVVSMTVSGCRQQQPTGRSPRTVSSYRGSDGAEYCPPGYIPAGPPAVVWRTVSGRTVILDPGHGGDDLGTNHFGLREKDINLDLAHRTAAMLRARGANVIMTRSSDVFIPLPERSAIANRNPNAAFVSIHVNASGSNPNAVGVETFVLSGEFTDAQRSQTVATRFRNGGDDSIQAKQALANLAVRSRAQGPTLAASIQRQMCGRLGETDRGVKPGNLAVLRETYFGPAVLVEVGFLTHQPTAERMRTEDWRRRTAEALCEGICDFLQRPE